MGVNERVVDVSVWELEDGWCWKMQMEGGGRC